MTSTHVIACIEAVHSALLRHEADIESLDRAIGDGDHYLNVRRGCTALMAMRESLLPMPPAAAAGDGHEAAVDRRRCLGASDREPLDDHGHLAQLMS